MPDEMIVSGPDLAAMDAKPASGVADTGPPAGSREAELATMAVEDPGVYRYAEKGKYASEHLKLKQERESAGKTEAVAAKSPVADDALDAETATDAGDGEATPTAEADAEPLEVVLDVPDSAEDYIEALPDEHWSRQDSKAQEFAAFLHENNMPEAAYVGAVRYLDQMVAQR
jgi:hypothetical protein